MTEHVPDVSVVIAVHDTMPYLTACLTSLVEQTIGHRRMEVVLVDDGSTDGSGAEIARFAARYPALFRTAGPPRPGGPADPADRGTDLARGRYLFYLGADHRLGAEALRRLVDAADRWEADVVVPRQAGGTGRTGPQGLFGRTRERVDLTDSALPWALTDTKLFRRELVVEHGLRRHADLPVHADQPFTLGALLHARKVSVLADYDYCRPVPREAPGGPARPAGPLDLLRGVRAVQQRLDELTRPGPVRDAVRSRHFGWDLPQLLQTGWLAEPPGTQRRIAEEIGALVDRHCPPGVFTRLPVPDRLRLALARRGELAALRALISHERAHGTPPVVHRRGRAYAAYPGFRDRRLGLPDALFELPGEPPGRSTGGAWRWWLLLPRPVRRGLRRPAARLKRAHRAEPVRRSA